MKGSVNLRKHSMGRTANWRRKGGRRCTNRLRPDPDRLIVEMDDEERSG
jgi:hypothetical protein